MIRTGFVWLVAAMLFAPAAARAGELSESRPCMGKTLTIHVDHRDLARARELLAEAFAEANRLDGVLSNWKPDSEVSRFNADAGAGTVRISADLASALELGQRLHQLTGGAFDVTLGPVIQLLRQKVHDPARLSEAQRLVGGRGLAVQGTRAALARRGMAVDLGGVGKGIAVDRIRDVLKRGGAHGGFIDFGGSLALAFGPVARAVNIHSMTGQPGTRIDLEDAAISISDSGLRESRIVDPRSGERVPARRQVAVIAQSAALAEGLTKAAIVLGRAWITGTALEGVSVRVRFVDDQGDLDMPAR